MPLGQERALGVERLIVAPVGIRDDRVHDDFIAILVDPRRVAAEHHRQLLLGESDPAQRPQVVVIERGRLHGDGGHPWRAQALADLRTRARRADPLRRFALRRRRTFGASRTAVQTGRSPPLRSGRHEPRDRSETCSRSRSSPHRDRRGHSRHNVRQRGRSPARGDARAAWDRAPVRTRAAGQDRVHRLVGSEFASLTLRTSGPPRRARGMRRPRAVRRATGPPWTHKSKCPSGHRPWGQASPRRGSTLSGHGLI